MFSVLIKTWVLGVDFERNLTTLDNVVQRLTQLHDVVLNELQRPCKHYHVISRGVSRDSA